MSYALRFGPYHPAFPSPVQVNLEIEGGVVRGAELVTGYSHRGLEGLAVSLDYQQNLALMERLCSCSGYSHALAFAQAVESASVVSVPVRARFIRTLAAELERLQAHLSLLTRCTAIIGLSPLAAKFGQLREYIADIVLSVWGGRLKYGLVVLGGVRRDLPLPEELAVAISGMKDTLYRLADRFIHDQFVADRMVGVGVLTLEDAQAFGVVGPVARASGISFDVRKQSPYAAYHELDVSTVIQTGGDVFSRFSVRLLECFESIRLIEQAAAGLPDGPHEPAEPACPAEGEGIGRVEGPGGECFHFVSTGGGGTPRRVHVRSASYANLPLLEKVLIGQDLEDVTLIVASFDPCFSCAER